MLTFRNKILASYAVLFVVLLMGMFAMVQFSVRTVVHGALADSAKTLIESVQTTPNLDQAIQLLKENERTFFYRVGLLDDQQHALYDSKGRKLFGPAWDPTYQTRHPEVIEALRDGVGYEEAWSTLFDQKFAYFAERFDFHGQTLVMRLAFPFEPIDQLTHGLEIGFILLTSLVLLIFAALTLLVITYLTRPVEVILQAIRPYQQGRVSELPTIAYSSKRIPSEFDQLAHTLNDLRDRIRSQIRDLVHERNEKLALLESLREGVIALTAPDQLSFINNAARTMLKLPPGSTDWNAVTSRRSDLAEHAHTLLLRTLQTRRVHEETVELHEPRLQAISLTCTPVTGENAALLVMHDITSQTQIIRLGKDFVANASHELRTPITIIRGFAETLHEYGASSTDALHDMTEKIIRNCSRMESLIQSLLLLADLENQPTGTLQPVDCQLLCEDCVDQLVTIHPQVRAHVKGPGHELCIAEGDAELLTMVITNLLNNAVKYSDPPARIDVRVERHHDFIQIEVQDHGIGISATDLPHIFDRFYRVDKARTRRLGGAGLGLAIVYTIVQRHNGTIRAESIPDQGTTFRIHLPTTQNRGVLSPRYDPM
ncbi:MAG: sensor histidine kinase [Chlamydiia bacterium]